MANYSRREMVTTHVEFLVPKGSASDEFDKAWVAASQNWAAIHRREFKDAPGNWATVDADDEHVIIRLIKTEEATA